MRDRCQYLISKVASLLKMSEPSQGSCLQIICMPKHAASYPHEVQVGVGWGGVYILKTEIRWALKTVQLLILPIPSAKQQQQQILVKLFSDQHKIRTNKKYKISDFLGATYWKKKLHRLKHWSKIKIILMLKHQAFDHTMWCSSSGWIVQNTRIFVQLYFIADRIIKS